MSDHSEPTTSDLLEQIIVIGKLPDGRMAVGNKRNQSKITREELIEIPAALRTWWLLMWETHFPGEEPEARL